MKENRQIVSHGYSTALHRQLAEGIRARLDELGRPQAWLAGEVGFSQKHVSMMLTGLADGSFEAWDRMAAAVGSTIALCLTPAMHSSGEQSGKGGGTDG